MAAEVGCHTGPVEPLDNPAWHALAGPHHELAAVRGEARRYVPGFSPFFGLPDEIANETWDDLRYLADGDPVALARRSHPDVADGWRVLFEETLTQYVATEPPTIEQLTQGRATEDVVTLGADDVDEMRALTKLTEPGPFLRRTIEFGHYIGVRDGDRLVAMAGERLSGTTFSEISAVCVHPDARRRGLGALLTTMLVHEINDRGLDAMLHVRSGNDGGHALYRSIGFTERAPIQLRVLGRSDRNEALD